MKHLEARGRVAGVSGGLAREAGFGIAWALATVVLGWAGLALDGRLGTTPLLALVGAVLGIAGGAASLWARVGQPESSGRRHRPRGEEPR